MTTILKIKSANFEGLGSSFAPAVTADLAGWWYPNVSMPKAVRNLAPGRAPAAAIGQPVVGAHSIVLDGANNNYLAPPISESESMTYLAVIKSPDTQADLTHRPYFMSTLGGKALADNTRPSTAGITLAAVGPNSLQFASARWNGSATSAQTITLPCDFSRWTFVVGRAGTLSRHLWNVTDGTFVGGATVWARDPSDGKFLLGKRVAGSPLADGLSEFAFAGVYSRYLSDTEVTAIYAQVKKYLGDIHGIQI